MLPDNNTSLYDLIDTDWQRRVREWEAWYSADPERILNYYALEARKYNSGRFYASQERRELDQVMHMPLAADIAAVSASLLFSESPEFDVADAVRERFEGFAEGANLGALLLEAAEIAAAAGGVYLKIDLDGMVSDFPVLSAMPPTSCRGVFHRGVLTDFLHWKVVASDEAKDAYWRLFESRSRSQGGVTIEAALYKGRADNIGSRVPMDSIPETRGFDDAAQTVPLDRGIGVVYVPNRLPNRLKPNSPQGVSDYQACISLLDALDEAYTSWMRDIEDGRSRLLIDESFLDGTKAADGSARFNTNERAFVKLSMEAARVGEKGYKPIEQVQFAIRMEEHKATCLHLIEQIVDRAGYSPASFGFGLEGRAESGTALRMRERKSMLTRNKKSRYWTARLKELLRQVGEFDRLVGGSGEWDIDVTLADSVVPDALELAQTVQALTAASAVSLERKVRIVNPDWTDEMVTAEVGAIRAETGLSLEPFEGEPVAGDDDEGDE